MEISIVGEILGLELFESNTVVPIPLVEVPKNGKMRDGLIIEIENNIPTKEQESGFCG